ncbi:hypothetical protein CEQ90_01190 [Lewinellaceae bacterium SD302]|nr:hypothetical protein CEQ90_01190 [Lewinellaceae bacterium SD302]
MDTSGGESEVTGEADDLMQLLPPSRTGVTFSNDLEITEEINPYTYRNFYNGAGVGLGDFNNDGLLDIFFTGNLVDNALYYNQGDFNFKRFDFNVAKSAANVNSPGSWSTGVTVVDINADGWDDIYVCKSGPPAEAKVAGLDGVRHNELFINQQDGTFTEEAAAYALDFNGLGVHATFFDYDQDGDLDVYLLSNSNRSVSGYDLVRDARNTPDPSGGNRLLRCNWPEENDGQIVYEDISGAAGIYRSAIGFGLGVTAGDVDNDGRTDLFVSNDYFERDYLYYNDGNGQLREALTEELPEISLGSMGADLADLDNDGLPELFVTEMLPATDERYKTKAVFQAWNRYQMFRDKGYHQQFGRNVLQWNRGNGRFSEVSRLAGVEATDWSWGALIFDIDGDGKKDIFVANGIGKDLIDQDYVKFDGNGDVIRKTLIEEGKSILTLFDKAPSEKLVNGVFRNESNLQFSPANQDWGMDQVSFSNGAAYGDLDNDGDLDLVVTNLDQPAFVYRNNSSQNHLLIDLQQEGSANPNAVGAKVICYQNGRQQYRELQSVRGFQSTVDRRLHFGLGEETMVDSLVISWPNGVTNVLGEMTAGVHSLIRNGSRITASAGQSVSSLARKKGQSEQTEDIATLLVKTSEINGVDAHQESDFVDFNQDGLLLWSISNEGPGLAVSSDQKLLFQGGAKGQIHTIYRLNQKGKVANVEAVLDVKPQSEAVDALFFDANNDGREDLYICHGGYEYNRSNTALLDQLYLNTPGGWKLSEQLLPSNNTLCSSSCAEAFDFDEDGDLDLFVGGRVVPGQYGLPATSYLLINDGKGIFKSKPIGKLGMVTDAVWGSWYSGGPPVLMVVGEFMPPTALSISKKGEILERLAVGDSGLWQSIDRTESSDGKIRYALGNHGLNSRLRANGKNALVLYLNDFDGNGKMEPVFCRRTNMEKDIPLALKDDLVAQLPGLRKQLQRYSSYAGKSIHEIFPPELVNRSIVITATDLASVEFSSETGDEDLEWIPLPNEAQLQPVYAIRYADLNGDATPDILLGGNQLTVKPELGIYAAGFGQVLLGDQQGGYIGLQPGQSGLDISGEIRAIAPFRNGKWIVGRSNDRPVLVERIER